ncbi:MAG: MBL fold metallo-hydrolase [Candidatus Altiarchaeota archaeon]|nr:MBL fold metallo-hydrolase [Candidatus Altiarchaeota archaeon]
MECNAYFVVGQRVALIDPGINPRRVLDKGREYNIKLNCFINTHCHFDHIGAAPALLRMGVESMAHELDSAAIESGDDDLVLGGLFGKKPLECRIGRKLRGGDEVDLGGGCVLEVVHTPGHTPGSVCLYEPVTKSLFTGDTVFADGVGRTDFMGGDLVQTEEERKMVFGGEDVG